MSDIPAGWHQDPSDPSQERWWDGQQWSSDQVRPKPPADVQPNQFPQQPQPNTTQFPNSGPTSQQFGQPPTGSQNQPFGGSPKQSNNGTLLLLVGGGIALFLIVALVGAVLLSGGDDDTVAASRSDATTQEATQSPAAPELATGEDPAKSSPSINRSPTDGTEDVSNCALSGEEAVVIDITNSTETMNDYYVELAYLDAAGSRVDDGTYGVSALRPGEAAKERSGRVDPDLGIASCEILEVSRRPVEFDQTLVDQVSACEINTDTYRVISKMTVTNPDAETYDYAIYLALVGPDGVRQSTGLNSVTNVRTNEPTAADGSLYGLPDEEYAGLTCEVVHVTRRDG